MNGQHNKSDQRNLLLAIATCALILFGYDYYVRMTTPAVVAEEAAETATAPKPVEQAAALTKPVAVVEANRERIELTSQTQLLTVDTEGGKLVNLRLPGYTQDDESVKLIGDKFHSVDAGWQGSGVAGPSANTTWTVVSKTANSTTLRWQNQTGQVFERVIALDPDTYQVQLTDKVNNTATTPVELGHYMQLHKQGSGETKSMYTYSGPYGFVDGERHKRKFKKLKKENYEISGAEGWWGIVDRYFAALLVPQEIGEFTYKFRRSGSVKDSTYSASVQAANEVLNPGDMAVKTYTVYAGPLSTEILETAGHDLEEAVDFGMFRLLANPLHNLMLWINKYLGNMGFTIVVVTVLIKLVLFPLAQKSYRSMQHLKELQPKMEKLKEKLGDNKELLGMEMMKMYKEEKINPAAGCWPMLIQIPIFFAFYKVILVSFEFRQADFMLWITDLSVKDPFFVLPVLMGASMWLQMRLSPTPTDEMQKTMMRMMPWIFTAMFLMFPSGLVLYWLTSNVFAIGQQWLIVRGSK